MAASPIDRINHAIARIETAMTRHRQASEALGKRHGELRARMADAVAALDDVIARKDIG